MIDFQLLDLIKKSKENSYWDFSNSVLYDLCRNNPEHKSKEIILAKIMLIGRSYAVAIERRKKDEVNDINDDFYISKVEPKISSSGIDDWICKSRLSTNLWDHIETHKKLTDLFYEISKLNKRSLASKYLHFHLPEIFFLYDSRVVKSIRMLYKVFRIDTLSENIDIRISDKEYAKFYLNCIHILKKIKENYFIDLNCRQLDNLLIEIGNSYLRHNNSNIS